jgi:hypothetical protein
MNVEIGTEAAQFPEKEYINGIFVALQPCHISGHISPQASGSFISVLSLFRPSRKKSYLQSL